MSDEKEVSVHICYGSGSPTCRCKCPDGPCEHVWDGEWKDWTEPSGAHIGSVTCSKCGMARIDHDMWCGP